MGPVVSVDRRAVAEGLAGVIPFFQFPPEIRKIAYTTNAIESLNMSLRKAIKTRGALPSEEAALKVMYLTLRNLARKGNVVQVWKEASTVSHWCGKHAAHTNAHDIHEFQPKTFTQK